MKPYERLMQKYDVTREELNKTIDEFCKGGLSNCCNSNAMIALVDLLTNGDLVDTTKNEN